nr:hypothetical protein [uncultured Acetatifactor sp.]
MERFLDWWKKEDRRATLLKALLLALVPLLCCVAYCAAQGRWIWEVYLPSSQWNDELFYYKQVEGILSHGYPQGYFGFNESHALKLSFAAWSPVLVFPWVIWGLLFGWNLASPVLCNIFLLSLACFLYVWLVRPSWRQLGMVALLFGLYNNFARYMLSGMPEAICFAMVILFYGAAVNYLRRRKNYKLVVLFAMSCTMTLMRPYLILFLLLPCWLWIWGSRRGRWLRGLGSAAILGAPLGLYGAINYYLGAEYITPLFYTDWIQAFFRQGVLGGLRFTFEKLLTKGSEYMAYAKQGLRTVNTTGAVYAGYLLCLFALAVQCAGDWAAYRRSGGGLDRSFGEDLDRSTGKGLDRCSGKGLDRSSGGDFDRHPGVDLDRSTGKGLDRSSGEDFDRSSGGRLDRHPGVGDSPQGAAAGWAVARAHLAFCFLTMLPALLLMYKTIEGSRHLLTFMAALIFLIPLAEKGAWRRTACVAACLGAAFAYLYIYRAADPYDYQVAYMQEERRASLEEWERVFDESLVLDREDVPNYRNVVIWVQNDVIEDVPVYTAWQLLYMLPEGFGINCCTREYVLEHVGSLRSRYLCGPVGGEIERLCEENGYRQLYTDGEMALYEIY